MAAPTETTPLVSYTTQYDVRKVFAKFKLLRRAVAAFAVLGDGSTFENDDYQDDQDDPNCEQTQKAEANRPAPADPEKSNTMIKLALVVSLIVLNVYENVLKGKAANLGAKFNPASILLGASTLSVVIGSIATTWYGDLKNYVLSVEEFSKSLFYIVPAAGFTFSLYFQFLAMERIETYVFGVLNQGRVLAISVMAKVFIGRSQSWSTWVVLISITLSTIVYSLVDLMSKDKIKLLAVIKESAANKTAALIQTDAITQGKKEPSPMDLPIGLLFTALAVLAAAAAGLFSEIVLKSRHKAPFYVQKTFMEMWGVPVSLLSLFVIGPVLEQVGIKEKSKGGVSLSAGWDNEWVIVLWLIMTLKQWVIIVLVKYLDALSNILSGVVAMTLIYPACVLHNATKVSTCPVSSIMCVDDLHMVDRNVLACGFLVVCCVISYATAKRDRDRVIMFHKAARELGSELDLGSV